MQIFMTVFHFVFSTPKGYCTKNLCFNTLIAQKNTFFPLIFYGYCGVFYYDSFPRYDFFKNALYRIAYSIAINRIVTSLM